METKKIAVACFIGGALCCAVALIFTPTYWWFGLIAGFAGGYISYEFREVRRAVPVAALRAAQEVRRVVPIALRAAQKSGTAGWKDVIVKAKAWFSKPHPFFYPAAVITAPFYLWVVYHYVVPEFVEGGVVGTFLFVIMFSALILAFVEATWVILAPFALLAFIGARAERCYWWPFLLPAYEAQIEEDVRDLEERGFRREPMTYLNALRWTVKGFCLTVMFFAWTLWKYLAIDVCEILCFFGWFAWHLFKLIHSKKRVLCAIDGTLGGAVSYIWLASASMSFAEQAVFVVFGGLLGAAFGAANWEIVSKRILRVSTSTS